MKLKTPPRKYFSQSLLRWYKSNARDLPWRRTQDPYKIWISEVMLQQTTVSAVIPFYHRWLDAYPTVDDLACASLHDVLKSWQGLGYYQRARNLHACAQTIVQSHGSQLPRDPETLRQLPGFGPYTVSAVLSIAFDQRQTIIDANVRRVVMRLLGIRGQADTKKDEVVREYLEDVFPAQDAGNFNQALMELGALVCRSREPLCNVCPVRKFCKAYAQGLQEIIPEPKKQTIKDIKAVIAIIEHRGKYFIQKRPPKGLLADLWEFPGGKIEKGENEIEALARELKEELGVNLKDAKHLFNTQHFYTQFRVNLSVWRSTLENLPESDATHRWVRLKALYEFPMPSGSARILDKLQNLSSH